MIRKQFRLIRRARQDISKKGWEIQILCAKHTEFLALKIVRLLKIYFQGQPLRQSVPCGSTLNSIE